MPDRWMRLFPGKPRSRAVLWLVLFLIATTAARAHSDVVRDKIGDSVLVLTGPWKFHPGDDMAWARPDFDDSRWGTQDLTPPENSYDPVTGSSGFVPGWTRHGYPGLHGYAWYRLHVQLEDDGSGGEGPFLAFTMPLNFDDAYQVFVNGRQIGEFGRFEDRSVVFYNSQPRSFQIPADIRRGALTIAIRFWMDASTLLSNPDVGGLHGPPLLGESSTVDAMLRLEWDKVNRTEIGNLLASVALFFAMLLGFTFFWFDRLEPAYLWLTVACFEGFLERGTITMGYYFTLVPMLTETFFLDVIVTPFVLGLWALFWAHWFGLENIRRVARTIVSLTVLLMLGMSLIRDPLFGTVIPVRASTWLVPVTLVLKLLLGVVLLWITWRGIRKRAADGWSALAPVLLMIVWAYQEELSTVHVDLIVRVLGLTISGGIIAALVMLAIISVLMMRRFIRGQRESVQLRLEIEQARQVQNVLIPEALPAIPGFGVESEYRPAQQVGGDFFQILPARNGGILAVIGDVSGKGTPAAMAVSLLVGAIRTLLRSTDSPGEILGVLNERMIGRSKGGFTTCLALRADPDGRLTIANAGHLAPYLEGKELATNPALPLGLAEGSYTETRFQLSEGEKLTLMTDGVLEACNKSGELFGFERTAAIAKDSAASIVRRAQEFGQNDDITVLTISRLAIREESTVVEPALFPSILPASI